MINRGFLSLQQDLIFSKYFLECGSMESLKMSDKLTTALQKLAISPVKADRLAICRLEKEYGASLSEIDHLTDNVNDLTNNVDRVLSRSAVLDDVLLELRDSQEQQQRNFEEHQRHFDEHQRTTNAALNSLEAILIQLIRIFPQS